MSIEIDTLFSQEEMLEAREWHWKSYGVLQHLWYVAGAMAAVLGIWLLFKYQSSAFALALIFISPYCFARKKLLARTFIKNLKTSPMFGERVKWRISKTGVTQETSSEMAQHNWGAFYKTITTPKGILIYPQKLFYYWLPYNGLVNTNQIDDLVKIFSENTNNYEIT
jgi:hypothetical protein